MNSIKCTRILNSYILYVNGDVYSEKRNRFLRPSKDKDGYLVLKVGGKVRKLHRLVAEAFLPNPQGLPEVNHKDFDRANPHVENLEWVSRKANIEHSKSNQIASAVRTYVFNDPLGDVVTITNLTAFCKDNNLNMNSMSKVHAGWRTFKSHKGWTKHERD